EDWEAGGVVQDVVTDGPLQLGDIEMPVGSIMVAFQNGAALKWVWAQDVPARLRREGGSDGDAFDLDDWAATNSGGAAEVFGFSAGEDAEVWSNSKGEWIPCLVQAVFVRETEADGFTVPPNTIKVESEAGTKYLMAFGSARHRALLLRFLLLLLLLLRLLLL
ncbi:unnamed protein product, partial [Prorocentrum cordatum]